MPPRWRCNSREYFWQIIKHEHARTQQSDMLCIQREQADSGVSSSLHDPSLGRRLVGGLPAIAKLRVATAWRMTNCQIRFEEVIDLCSLFKDLSEVKSVDESCMRKVQIPAEVTTCAIGCTRLDVPHDVEPCVLRFTQERTNTGQQTDGSHRCISRRASSVLFPSIFRFLCHSLTCFRRPFLSQFIKISALDLALLELFVPRKYFVAVPL